MDECTSADTGVGAAMAAGSQLIKGYCALFVMAATTSKEESIRSLKEDQGQSGNQWVLIDHAMENKIKISPNRFVIAVIIAAL